MCLWIAGFILPVSKGLLSDVAQLNKIEKALLAGPI